MWRVIQGFRSTTFVIVLSIVVCALSETAIAEEAPIPPYKDNQAAIDYYWLLRERVIIPPRFVSLPISPAVNKIVVDVRGPNLVATGDDAAFGNLSARLDRYALRLLQSRLRELGVGELIQVSFFDSMSFWHIPYGEECATLTIEFVLHLSEQNVDGQNVVALMGDTIASLQRARLDNAGRTSCNTIEAPWVMRGGPLLAMT
ncbi:MAG: hypothetical protein AAAC47_10955, partial [Pararhizobium sp.]